MKRRTLLLLGFALLGILLHAREAGACTNFLVTKGASKDGSTMISYAADSHYLYGELYFWPAAKYPKGALCKVYEWDTGRYLGEIPQVEATYSVVGNMNEHQLAIAETTYGGRPELVDTMGLVDYGSLIYLTLQRARTAREAIKVMTELVKAHGYASSGESFSIADPNEVWILELIGKGVELKQDRKSKTQVNARKGTVWVAMMVPDGYVSAHANQARIQQFPLADGKTSITDRQMEKIFSKDVTTVYAHDAISFARQMKYFNGKDEEFSFSDTYAPVDFGAARFCDARVWSFFKGVAAGMDKYLDYAKGQNLANRMPLFVKPTEKISLHQVMDAMRDHLEGTELDMSKDPGAGPHGLPYRWRPMTWEYNGKSYVNERATATQQTGFVFVTQSRSWLPDPVGGVLWFGVDDAASAVFTPMYCGILDVPPAYRQGNGSLLEYSPTSGFWLFNKVTNFTYLRYNLMHADLRKEQLRLENKFIADAQAVEAEATRRFESSAGDARRYLTEYSLNATAHTMASWQKLFEFLLLKYIDGNVKQEENGVFKHNEHTKTIPAKVANPEYPDWWKEKVVKETGDKLLQRK